MSRIITSPPEGPAPDGAKPAGWWQDSEDGTRLLCGLCPRACTLGPGDRGFCFVRQNQGGRMVSTTYGRSTGFCVDPVEKKPLNHFYPGTSILSFGTAGCNLGCRFCQNWEMSRSRDVDAACQQADPQAIARAAVELGCRSVAFTYNDPIVWAEYAIDTARACHAAGVKTVAVTSGYITPAARTAFYEHIDAANVDLKGFTEDFYRKLTGGHLEPVLDTLRWIARESRVWLEITNLIIPEANDDPADIERMCRWIVEELGPDVPLHFTAFHPDFKLTDRPATPTATLIAAHDTARRAGLRYVYTGNVLDRRRQSTYCPACNEIVIGRDGYALGEYAIRGGRCRHCDAPIAGHFDDAPGTWGGRRQPVRIDKYAEAKKDAAPPKPPPAPRAPDTIAPTLTKEQEDRIFRAAGQRVAAVVRSQRPESIEEVLGEAAGTRVYGAFVSLKRRGQLRSCCGFLGQTVPLWEALGQAAIRAAKDDPRFPPISPSELDQLDMEVWLLWGLQPVMARGKDRVAAVTIGKHGVQIARGNARGLLLPGVAVEHRLDALAFLQQVCLKAGLPTDAWRQDDTVLMTFEGYSIHGRLAESLAAEQAAETPNAPGGPTPAEVAALAAFCRENLLTLVRGATPNFYLPGGFDGEVCGISLTFGPAESAQRIECSKLALRPEIPLQSTLFTLVETAARLLQSRRLADDAIRATPLGLSVLWDVAVHGTAAEADLSGVDPQRRAVLLSDAGRWVWIHDPQRKPEELLDEAIVEGRFPDREAARVFSLAVASTDRRVVIAQLPRPTSGPEVRPAAVAGSFYPGTAREIERAVDDLYSAADVMPEPWSGVLVPHAGWVYSARLAAATFARVKIPRQVIILSPRHRPVGAPWAVAPHGRWSWPGRELESDPGLARQLAEAVEGLELDAAAHQQEHAIEVQLPLVARLAPQARVVGIAIGGGSWPRLCRFAHEMAGVLGTLPERPLLVVSSDMNHFADEVETRRRDELALAAIESLDPERLYHTVLDEQISMCGMFAAVIVMETLRQLGALHRCQRVGYATSAETSGDTHRVVGYAGLLFG